MKQSKFTGEPFCGFPDGFHEFASLPEMSEDDCCIHCGRPRHEIESSQQSNPEDQLRAGIPCEHPGCLSHVLHPCEGCGRIAGR